MKDKTAVKIVSYLCGTAIVLMALAMGYDSYLTVTAILALWGSRELLAKEKKKNEN